MNLMSIECSTIHIASTVLKYIPYVVGRDRNMFGSVDVLEMKTLLEYVGAKHTRADTMTTTTPQML